MIILGWNCVKITPSRCTSGGRLGITWSTRVFFFFQAEDGIRDAQESRGLGDVYKRQGLGCQRCHNPSMKDESGKALPYDCTLCHSILAYDSTTPFAFLGVVDRHSPQAAMHEYLRDEFVRSRSGPGVSAPELLPSPRLLFTSDAADDLLRVALG